MIDLKKDLNFLAQNFLKEIYNEIQLKKINLDSFEIDHLCFRVASQDHYHIYKEELHALAVLLDESMVGGRLISTFKLDSPLVYQNQKITCLELPSPKEGSFYETGLEHAEFVIDSSFEDFIKVHPHINFDLKGTYKNHNPELKIQLTPNKAIKLHHQSLENVIKMEQQESQRQ